MPIDVQDLDVDFYAFGGHKLYGPSGIGFFMEKKILELMSPYQGGGGMINTVSFEKTTWADLQISSRPGPRQSHKPSDWVRR